jgi:hypothetical protein
MAPQVLTYPGTRPTEKGEHCGHHQSTAFPPRRPRPPGRAPPRLQRWLDNARRARGRPRDGRGVGRARALPLQQVRGAKQGRRECSPGRGILRGPGPFIRSIGWSIGAKERRPRPPPHSAANPAPDILATWVGGSQASLLVSDHMPLFVQKPLVCGRRLGLPWCYKRNCKKLSACKRKDAGNYRRKNISCCTHQRQR